jgi:acyl dehydratase
MPVASDNDALELDGTDVDRWLGASLQRLPPRDPITEMDIGRWSQNPNPLSFDPDFAAASRFGRIVAPHSFTVAAGDGQLDDPAR